MIPTKAQINLVERIRQGVIPLPANQGELLELAIKLVTASDVGSSAEFEKTKNQFLSLAAKRADQDGWVYISQVLYPLSQRKYFQRLSKEFKKQGLTADREVIKELVRSGFLSVHGNSVMATSAGKEYLDSLKKDYEL